MGSFFGKLIRYVFRFCLILIMGLFIFGLIKFKGNFVDYVNYLNNINIKDVLSKDKIDQDINLEEEKDSSQIDVMSGSIDENYSGVSQEDDYFLPESGSGDYEDVTYGFSGTMDTETEDSNQELDTSTSKQDLVNLIKSREK